ncbi:MAG TPA: hypothetical protein VN888_21630 [Mycobacterium sp.]|nr:hypothetical protein [Mycobacterium sp.]
MSNPQAVSVNAPGLTPVGDAETPQARTADRWLLAGCLLCGSFLLGPIGLFVLAYGLVLLRRAKQAGQTRRPMAVTVFALFSIIDAATNTVGWSVDTFAHDTHLAQVLMNGYGRILDGAYYLDYNTTIFGGVSIAGEKSMQVLAVVAIFPLRIAAAWAFLKLKRWGYNFMIITSWGYVFFWFAYMTNLIVDFPQRMGASEFGWIGFWIMNLWYVTPFVLLPWLYSLNKDKWNR